MKIIIIGDGKVGYSLAENLSGEGNDITIIDKNASVLKKSDENLDVMCIKGNGVSAKTLIDAGVKFSDVLIAATSSDEINMVCCLTAKKLGAKRTIARIRDPEYANELFLLKDELGLDMVINPEQVAAYEITRIIKFPSAINVEGFAKNKVEMVEIKVTKDMNIAGIKIKDIPKSQTKSVLIGAVLKNGIVIIPNGDLTIEENDVIYIFGRPTSVYEFCRSAGKITQRVKNTMIIGGGRIAYYLANQLDDIGVKVKIIEIDSEKCLRLSEMLPNTLIINGDGTDEELLRSEDVNKMDAFVSITGKDEENLMSALLAKQHGALKVIPKINRSGYAEIVNKMGIESVITPKTIITNHILRYVRGLDDAVGNKIETLFRILNDNAEILEFHVKVETEFLQIPLHKLGIMKNTLIAAIVRGNEVIIPRGNDVIKKNDRVIVITKFKNISDLKEIMSSGGAHNELQDSIKKFGDIINM